MKRATQIARILLGLIFLIFGSNYFLGFIEIPPAEDSYLIGLAESGFVFPIVKPIEILAGLALILGLYVPLALVLLAPIVINIFLYHAVLTPDNLPIAVVLLVLSLFLAYSYRGSYAGVLKRNAQPG